jgi:hypothetical protein
MRTSQLPLLSAAFLLAFLAIGLPYWQIPYSKVALPGSILGLGLWVTFFSAAILRCVFSSPFLSVFIALSLPGPSAVMLRILVEVAEDSTSHNLWPLELILVSGVSVGVTLAGILIGTFLSILFRKFHPGRDTA